ncbi:uncharacterized protein LOC111571698 isoform X2 [Amphiprion ocellaris]|nr:uncharacterized protein LOC111571698 isoform X2 [Amphiprion ocellaris]
MEVSVRREVACVSETNKDVWNAAFKPAYSSFPSPWQVMFQKDGELLTPMNLSDARKQGYVINLTDGRLVLRTAYGQPESFSVEVNGVPVELVHATLLSRQSWLVFMVDLVVACSMHEGLFDRGYIMWETPEALYPSLDSTQISVGLNGELMMQSVAEERGYIVDNRNTTVHISIPYNADGGYRKSLVSGELYEYYILHLYVEQTSQKKDNIDTRLRFHGTLVTPLLLHPVFTENRTVLEDHTFTVYLGDVPEDVKLAAVHVNGHLTNASVHTIVKVVQPNNTHGYTLKVPFDDPVVIQQFSKENATLLYRLDIDYTLTVEPENNTFYHVASVTALTDISPPAFYGLCYESGIGFKLDHRPFDYLWEISVGTDLLTSELAAQHGYILSNDSQSLLLNVPLFTHGYQYSNVTLKGFFATFEILVRDRETSAVQSSTVKTCPFPTTELIMCSTDGRMTAVVDLSLAILSGGSPGRTSLIDNKCGPKEADGTRALFSFPVSSCGSIIKLAKEYVTYENEIFFSQKLPFKKNPVDSNHDEDGIKLQCTYPLAGLHRLFSVYKFESDTIGIGRIVHPEHFTEGSQSTTTELTTMPTTRRITRPVSLRLAYHPPAQYFKVSRFLKKLSKKGPVPS